MEIENGLSVDILEDGHRLRILGTTLAMEYVTPADIQNRLASGWKLFWAMKPILLERNISLKRRLKPF